jgi:thiamine-phosphate pyrophosphorylase
MLICVTNRKLCNGDFLQRIEQLAMAKPHAIMLREKDLKLEDYEALAKKVLEICETHEVPMIINQNITVAKKLKQNSIHLSMADLRTYKNELEAFKQVGASVHSVEEAVEAALLGADYLVAGHIFPTDSKKGMPPRGIGFLKDVCNSVAIPVFAIGGITRERVSAVMNAGAKGVCIMSVAMNGEGSSIADWNL